jgi:hypothetical protein
LFLLYFSLSRPQQPGYPSPSMAAQPGLNPAHAYEGRVRRLRKKRRWIVSGVVFAIVLCSLGVHLFVNLERGYGEAEGQGIVGVKPPWQWQFPAVRATHPETLTSHLHQQSH